VADLPQLPPQFELERAQGRVWAVRRDRRAACERAGYGFERRRELEQSSLAGRKPLYELALDGRACVVRRFSHGGIARALTGGVFLDPARPFRELVLAARLADLGLATPAIVAARAERARPWGWRLELVSERVPDSVDLGHVLARARAGEIPRARVGLLAAALGSLVRKLHAAQFVHADLTPNNVLVERAALLDGEPRLWLLDLDRSRFVPALDERTRRDNLRRLWRFVERRELRDGRALSRADVARFFLGYDPSGASWKADWRAIEREHRRMAVWHRLGWFLQSLYSRARDPRSAPLAQAGPAGSAGQTGNAGNAGSAGRTGKAGKTGQPPVEARDG